MWLIDIVVLSGMNPRAHKKYQELKARRLAVQISRLAFKGGLPKSGTVKLLFDYKRAEELLIQRPDNVPQRALLVPMVKKLSSALTSPLLSNNNKESLNRETLTDFRPSGMALKAAMEKKSFDIMNEYQFQDWNGGQGDVSERTWLFSLAKPLKPGVRDHATNHPGCIEIDLCSDSDDEVSPTNSNRPIHVPRITSVANW